MKSPLRPASSIMKARRGSRFIPLLNPRNPAKTRKIGLGVGPDPRKHAAMRWVDQPIFFIDFEGSLGSGVLEYGIATLHQGRVTATLTRLCAPTGRVRAEDTEIHGLD